MLKRLPAILILFLICSITSFAQGVGGRGSGPQITVASRIIVASSFQSATRGAVFINSSTGAAYYCKSATCLANGTGWASMDASSAESPLTFNSPLSRSTNTISCPTCLVSGGALGTPSSGTLTNTTGLPESGLSLTDVTTNNASITKHGFLPKLPNDATKFLNGLGAWATVSAGVTCSGCTTNTLPKTTGVGALGDSRVVDDVANGVVDIGDTSGTYLEVGTGGGTLDGTATSSVNLNAGTNALVLSSPSGNDAFSLTMHGGATGSLVFDGSAKTITATASTESLAIDGTAHTANIVAAGAVTVNSLPLEQTLSSTASVNMNTGTATSLYTCPTGKSCIVTRVIVRNASTSLTTASYSFGWNSASFNDVVANATHTELTGSTLYTVLFSKAGAKLGVAVDVFSVKMNTTQGGAATTTVDVIGYIF